MAEKHIDTNDERKATYRHKIQFRAKNEPIVEKLCFKPKEKMR